MAADPSAMLRDAAASDATRVLAVSDAAVAEAPQLDDDHTQVWLGQTPDGRHWVASLGWSGTESGLQWTSLRELLVGADDDFSAIASQAIALAAWHRDHGFSPVDGSPADVVHAGWARQDGQGRLHFPRTDPAVIVLIRNAADDRVLLANNAAWDPNRYSLIAGFVDPGESLESAVQREALEETGIAVDGIRYIRSQPWPFPRSLMVGFTAVAEDPEALRVDGVEIRHARWLSRSELAEPAVTLPGHESIARRLLTQWLAHEI